MNIESLYLHWPFCPYKCHFCPFVALAGQDNYMGQYSKALIAEIENFSKSVPDSQKKPIKTVFFGGGTPSTCPKEMLLDICGILKKEFVFDKDYEFTIEVNPGTVDLEKLKLWKEVGINRLSIGVQSLDNKILHKLNRHQYAQDVLNLMEIAPKLFDNISIDLIIGLPEVTDEYWNSMIDQIVTWPINHISMYFLTIHEDTPLYFGVKQNKIALPNEESTIDLYLNTIEKFEKAGLKQYEISNFAKTGYESRHNRGYWTRVGYKGFGLGACSYDGINIRTQNEKNLMKYITNANTNSLVPILDEKLTEDQIYLENVMLGLRQRSGISLKYILSKYNKKEQEQILQVIEELKEQELILLDKNNTLSVTRKGIPVVNEIVVKILI